MESVKYFGDFENDVSLEESLIYMCLTPILYIGILFVLDHQLIQKFRARMKPQEVPYYTTDEQVKREKLNIAQKISTMNGCKLLNHFNKEYYN